MKKTKKAYKKIAKKDLDEVIKILSDEYKDAVCGLNYTSPLSLTISLILAAQCTDARVNEIAPILLNKYPDVYSLSEADIIDIENIIYPCGFYKSKAKSIKLCSKKIIDEFDGIVPCTMEDLTSLAGIGRKSANIILQECFNITVGIAVDTHVTRISRKIGITNSKTQELIEKDLMKKIPKIYWNKINHILVNHGRKYCIANRPNCTSCPINNLCKKND